MLLQGATKLCIIHVRSLILWDYIYICLHFLPILSVKLSFPHSVFWIFGFLIHWFLVFSLLFYQGTT